MEKLHSREKRDRFPKTNLEENKGPETARKKSSIRSIAAILALTTAAGACSGDGTDSSNQNTDNAHSSNEPRGVVGHVDDGYGFDENSTSSNERKIVDDTQAKFAYEQKEMADDQNAKEQKYLNSTVLAELRAKVSGNRAKELRFEQAVDTLLRELEMGEQNGNLTDEKKKEIDRRYGGYELVK